MDEQEPAAAPDPPHVHSRAELLPEEEAVGSADPEAQAEAILTESLERTEAPHDSPDAERDGEQEAHAAAADEHEHRRSEDTV